MADTGSIVYHAYRGNQDQNEAISKEKLFYVTYGRLRFVAKNIAKPFSYYYFLSYLVFDFIYLVYTLIRNKFVRNSSNSIINGWVKFLNNYDSIKKKKVVPRKVNNFVISNFHPTIKNGIPVYENKKFNRDNKILRN